MRKLLKIAAIICIALYPTVISAHENTIQQAHLKFKQVEIKGKPSDFFSALLEKGFTYIGSNQKQVYGLFAGHEVTVTLDKTITSGTVYQVLARMKPRSTWNEVEADYSIFKTNLTKKYGQPSLCREKFHDPYRKGDGFEIKAAVNSKLEYLSCWMLPEGEITIQVISNGKDLILLIRYTDTIGNNLQQEEKTNLFLEDL